MKSRFVSFMMAFVMILSVLLTGGCANNAKTSGADAYETAGTIDGEAIDYQLLYFVAMYEQANYEASYLESYGEGMWQETINGTTTLEENVKETILKEFKEMLILEKFVEDYNVRLTTQEQGEIRATAKQFMEDNTEEAIKMTGASEEIVARYLELYTIANKMYDRIVADVDIDYEKEEYKQSTFSYVMFDKKEHKLSDVELILADAKEDYQATFGEGSEYTLKECSYGATGTKDTNISEEVLEAVAGLENKEVYDKVLVTKDAYFILRMEDTFDEDASNAMHDAMQKTALESKYNEVLSKYYEQVELEIDEEAWASIRFTNHFTIVSE